MAETIGIGKKKKTAKVKAKASAKSTNEKAIIKPVENTENTKQPSTDNAEAKKQSPANGKNATAGHTRKTPSGKNKPGKRPQIKKKQVKQNKTASKTK